MVHRMHMHVHRMYMHVHMASVTAVSACRQRSGAPPLRARPATAQGGCGVWHGYGMGRAGVWQRTAGVYLEQWLLQHRHGGGVGLGEDADLWVGGWAGGPVREGEKSGVESGQGSWGAVEGEWGRGGGGVAEGGGCMVERGGTPRGAMSMYAWCRCMHIGAAP
jgi:hypothetical protein